MKESVALIYCSQHIQDTIHQGKVLLKLPESLLKNLPKCDGTRLP